MRHRGDSDLPPAAPEARSVPLWRPVIARSSLLVRVASSNFRSRTKGSGGPRAPLLLSWGAMPARPRWKIDSAIEFRARRGRRGGLGEERWGGWGGEGGGAAACPSRPRARPRAGRRCGGSPRRRPPPRRLRGAASKRGPRANEGPPARLVNGRGNLSCSFRALSRARTDTGAWYVGAADATESAVGSVSIGTFYRVSSVRVVEEAE